MEEVVTIGLDISKSVGVSGAWCEQRGRSGLAASVEAGANATVLCQAEQPLDLWSSSFLNLRTGGYDG